jgi:hypothetical protein
MPARTIQPRNRIILSGVVLVLALSAVWYQRTHPGARTGAVSDKPFLSKAPSAEGNQQFAWVPAYPGAKISDIRTKMTRGELSYGFSFLTHDPFDQVLSFYRQQLQNAGFKVEVSNAGGGGRLHADDPADKRTLDMTSAKTAEGSETGILAVEK